MNKFARVLAIHIVLVAGSAALVPNLWAQDQETTATTQDQQAEAASPRSPEQVVQHLAEKLNLTEDQKTQITPIIADRQQKLSELRGDTSMRPMQRMRKAKSIFHDTDKKINAILNDQQRQQYAQIEQEMRQEMKQRKQSRQDAN
jgi:periplasmic protein CpxP/Spy